MRETPSTKTPSPSRLQGKKISDTSGPNRLRIQTPAAFSNFKNSTGSIGDIISRPRDTEQWPLGASEQRVLDRSTQELVASPPMVKIPPKRPPRPSYVPSILDPSRSKTKTTLSKNLPQAWVAETKDVASPSLHTSSSRPSSYTSSSISTIPDFPIPRNNQSLQRNLPPLGLSLTSSTSKPSSHKSLASPIPTIPEEPQRLGRAYSAYASSTAIPSGWGSTDSPEHNEISGDDTLKNFDLYKQEHTKPNEAARWKEFNRNSYAEDFDDITNYGDYDGDNDEQLLNDNSGPQEKNRRPTSRRTVGKFRLSSQAIKLEANRFTRSSILSEEQKRNRGTSSYINSDSDSPLASEAESNSMKGEDLDSLVSHTPDRLKRRTIPLTRGTLFNRISSRPNASPSLNDNSIDSRWSATSLPDLILRATKLAALIDRGKRPGSTTYLDNYNRADDVEKGQIYENDQIYSPRSQFSDPAANFSPPGSAKPNEVAYTESVTTDPSTKQQKEKPKRFCCLPNGYFILLTIPIIIILAAIFIPLTLFVFMKQNHVMINSRLDNLNFCAMSSLTSCQNGGTSILLDDNSCGCICTNGFDGPTCTSEVISPGCVNSTISGMSVTLGSSIERLITGAQTNFSIPLDASRVIPKFDSANMTCATENSLVTFNGKSSDVDTQDKNILNRDIWIPEREKRNIAPMSDSKITKKSDLSLIIQRTSIDNDISGISISQPATNAALNTRSTLSRATSKPTDSPSTKNSLILLLDEVTLDFARVATLYVLQETTLNEAINVQSSFQRFFNGFSFLAPSAENFTLSNDESSITVDFVTRSLDLGLGNGIVGGIGGSSDSLKEMSKELDDENKES